MSAMCTAWDSCLAWMPSSVLVLGVSASRNGQIEPPAYPKYLWKPATSNHSAMASTTRTASGLRFGQVLSVQQNAISGIYATKFVAVNALCLLGHYRRSHGTWLGDARRGAR